MSAQYGFVYLLGHDCMPGVYKVGCTERSPHQRMQELSNSTSVPGPFDLLCYIEVEDHQAVERQFHKWLDAHRVNPGREFFRAERIEWIAGLFQHYRESLAFAVVGLGAYMWRADLTLGDVIDVFQKPPDAEPEPEATTDLKVVGGTAAQESGECRAA